MFIATTELLPGSSPFCSGEVSAKCPQERWACRVGCLHPIQDIPGPSPPIEPLRWAWDLLGTDPHLYTDPCNHSTNHGSQGPVTSLSGMTEGHFLRMLDTSQGIPQIDQTNPRTWPFDAFSSQDFKAVLWSQFEDEKTKTQWRFTSQGRLHNGLVVRGLWTLALCDFLGDKAWYLPTCGRGK